MASDAEANARRILICAPYGRDGASLAELLVKNGLEAEAYADLGSLALGLGDTPGAVLLTEEALAGDRTEFERWLRDQPAWSDLPILLLCKRRMEAGRSLGQQILSASATNVMVLERPLGAGSLVSAVDSVLRSRQRQFETGQRIAELRASEAALAASDAELRTVTDALPMMIGFIDRDLRYRFANRAYVDWFGIDGSELIGRDVREVVARTLGEGGFEERREGIERALRGEAVTLTLPWPSADGARREADIRYLPRRRVDGEVDGFHVFVQDVTVRIRAEEVLREAAEALEARVAERTAALEDEMKARLEVEEALRQAQKMDAVGQLTGGIAHDFNNMLTGVLGSLSIIRRRIAAGRLDDLDRFIEAATTSSERAAALTQRLLAFSRRQSLHLQPTEVSDLVRSLGDLLRQAVNEDIEIVLDLPSSPMVASVDPHQLENALLNLVINARDAMPAGGVITIALELAEDQAAAPETPSARQVVIRVGDTGVGMEPEILEKVFEPFFTTKPIGQGTGLGLSMVYGFAQQSGGSVHIASTPGMGTTISLFLCEAESEVTVAAPLKAAPLPDGEGQRVLFVEDDPSVRLLIQEVLAELGFDAVEAAGPDLAMEILASNTALSLMITDVGLPGMNGRQLADVARLHRPNLPILFITGYAENAAMRGDFLGANMAMITKPFSIENLSQRIQTVLAQ